MPRKKRIPSGPNTTFQTLGANGEIIVGEIWDLMPNPGTRGTHRAKKVSQAVDWLLEEMVLTYFESKSQYAQRVFRGIRLGHRGAKSIVVRSLTQVLRRKGKQMARSTKYVAADIAIQHVKALHAAIVSNRRNSRRKEHI